MSDPRTKKVSVCLASYNGEQYIQEQLLSILPQLSHEDEIVISDDGSTDRTLEIISGIDDQRIRVFPNEKAKGVVGNFENALEKATGDYIFLSDQDDIWLPDKREKMLELLLSYDLVVSDCAIVDEKRNVLQPSFFEEFGSGRGFWKNVIKNTYLGCCMAFRKDLLNYALPFPPHIAMHDIWLGLTAEIYGKPYFADTPLLLYRRHSANASFTSEKSQNSLGYKIAYRMKMLYELLKRIVEQKYKL